MRERERERERERMRERGEREREIKTEIEKSQNCSLYIRNTLLFGCLNPTKDSLVESSLLILAARALTKGLFRPTFQIKVSGL